ncbi:c2h2 type zinc finger domain [Lecanosticta acicola]|uniref:C2h2 type zinc finger domain n=1 Tax=Lecanosticta acicola TaxID=111012 RepID=A0AAI8Z8P0_9PEZI|nr:c2h2 type zinc finger domain [Lecanosticta acicola]
MSGHHHQPSSSNESEEYAYTQTYAPQDMHPQTTFPGYQTQYATSYLPPQDLFGQLQQYQSPPQYRPFQGQSLPSVLGQPWTQPAVPATYGFFDQPNQSFPQYLDAFQVLEEPVIAGPSPFSTSYLSPGQANRPRTSRATSWASNASSISEISRSVSPNASEMLKWGCQNENGSWSCAYPGCSSKSTFNRGCDLRKHYKRHTKSLFCRHDGCPQSKEGGFSSKKDRARHEAKHNPNVVCEWKGCERLFSRQDNMKDHVRRVHKRQTA